MVLESRNVAGSRVPWGFRALPAHAAPRKGLLWLSLTSVFVVLLVGALVLSDFRISSGPILAALFLLFSVGALKLSELIYGDLFSPLGVYLAIWFLMIGMFHLGLVEYIPIRVSTWLLLFSSILAFAFGCLLVTVVRLAKRKSFKHGKPLTLPDPTRFLWVIRGVFVLAAIGSLVNVLEMVRRYGLYTVLLEPWIIRWAMGRAEFFEQLQVLTFLNEATIILCAFYLFAYRRLRPAYVLLLPVLSFGYLLMSTGRTRPLYALIAAFSVWLSVRGERKLRWRALKQFALVAILALAIFGGMGTWIGKSAYSSEAYLKGYTRFSTGLEIFALPYIYFTSNVAGFEALIQEPPEYSLGRYTFRAVYRFVHVIDPGVEVPSPIEDFRPVPFYINSGTYLSTFYRDFGVTGIWLMPFLIGVLTTLIFTNFRTNPRFLPIYTYAVFFFGLINSVFVEQIIEPVSVYLLVVGVILNGYLARGRARNELAPRNRSIP